MLSIRMIFVLFVGILSLQQSQAQTELIEKLQDKKISLGPQVGFTRSNLIWFESDAVMTWSSITKLTVGANVMIPLSDKWSLQSGMHLVTKGTETSPYWGTELSFSYIEVPILAQWQKSFSLSGLPSSLQMGNEIQVLGLIGPYVAQSLGSRVRTFGYRETLSNREYNRLDWGLSLGGGCQVNVMDKPLQCKLMYNVGFRDIYKSPTVGAINRSLQATMCYFFF